MIDSLTGVRFFAALWVLLLHFREYQVDRIWKFPIIDPFVAQGTLGVDLFFVLSGFIMSHVYRVVFRDRVTKASYRGFIIYRVARLYPVHFATFAMMVGMAGAQSLIIGSPPAHPERYSWLAVVTTLTMTHDWFVGIYTPNMPAWSISSEFAAYLFFPFLMVLISKQRWVAGVYALAGFLILFVVRGSLDPETASGFFFKLSLGRIAGGFLIGMAAFQIAPAIQRWMGQQRFWSLASVAGIFALGWFNLLPAAVAALFFAALIIFLSCENDLLARPLASRLIVYLGEISYALYMIHWPVRTVIRTAIEKAGLSGSISPPIIILVYSAVALIGAALLHAFVEKPGRRLIRNLADGSARKSQSAMDPVKQTLP